MSFISRMLEKEINERENGPLSTLTKEVPVLEKHTHAVAIVSVTLATLIAGVFFYTYTKNTYFSGERITEEESGSVVREKYGTSDSKCTLNSDMGSYNEATSKSDVEYCNCIKDEEIKDSCFTSVQDVLSYNNAVAYMDVALCEEIKTVEFKDACKQMIEGSVAFLKENDPQRLADMYSMAHNEGAIEEYESLLETDPKDRENLLNLSLAYAEKGLREQEKGGNQVPFAEKAISIAEKANELYPKDSEVLRVLAYAYEILPDYNKAHTLYGQAIAIDSNNLFAYAGRGHVRRIMMLLDIALEDFLKAAELDAEKKYIHIYTNLCNLYYSKNDIQEGIRYCKIVTEKDGVDPLMQSEANQILASIYMRNFELDEARSRLIEAVALTPSDPNVFITFSRLNIFENNFSEAEMNARKAIELSPTKATAQLALSRSLYVQDKFEEAIKVAKDGMLLIDIDVSLLPPSRDVVKRDFYELISFNYRELGDADSQVKYENLAKEALK